MHTQNNYGVVRFPWALQWLRVGLAAGTAPARKYVQYVDTWKNRLRVGGGVAR